MKKIFTTGILLILAVLSLFFSTKLDAAQMPPTVFANHVFSINQDRDLENILDQIVPSDRNVILKNLTATAAELNVLDGISGNVTTAALNQLTGGGQTAGHTHAAGAATNADTLDDIDSGSFLRSDVSDNFTLGELTFNSGTGLVIANGGTLSVLAGGTAAFQNTTGTAPFTVLSTTVVTSLNSDTLDAVDSASFLRSDANDNMTAGELTFDAGAGLVIANGGTLSVLAGGTAAFQNTTGTAPFTVLSTTVVTSLNSDTLDAVDSGSFLRSDANDNMTAGELTFDAGTGLVIANGGTLSVIAGGTAAFQNTTGTAPFTVSSTTVVTSLNSDTLDAVDSASFLRSDANDNFTSGQLTFDAGTHLVIADGATLSVLGGLSADTLDGIDSTSFLRSDANDDFTSGELTFDAGTGLVIANGGTLSVIAGGTAAFQNTTGTAPFTVLSTTVVTSLNSDTLDAVDSASFLRSDANDDFTSGELTFDAGTGLVIANGGTLSVIAGGTAAFQNTTGTAPFTVLSTTVVTSLNSDTLDAVDSGSFLRSDAADNFTSGELTLNAGTALTIADGAGITVLGAGAGGTGSIFAALGSTLTVAGQFFIGGSVASADVTGTNLNDLTDGGATTLHSHAGGGGESLDATYDVGQLINIDSADLDLNLSDATNDYRVDIDNTTTGDVAIALIFNTTGSGATIGTAINLDDAAIVRALSIGANEISGTNLRFDGAGQLELGPDDVLAGSGGVGPGIITFRRGGTIDTTKDGDLVFAPQDAGIIDIPNGVTLRFPANDPSESRNGIYYDNANTKLCIDDDGGTNICTAALTLLSMDEEESNMLTSMMKNKEGIRRLTDLVSEPEKMDALKSLSKTTLTYKDLERLYQVSKNMEYFQDHLAFEDGQLALTFTDDLNRTHRRYVDTSSEPMILARGSGQLNKGTSIIEFSSDFLVLMDVNEKKPPRYKVQVTPTLSNTMDQRAFIKGALMVEKHPTRFIVFDSGDESQSMATFDWEVAAPMKRRNQEQGVDDKKGDGLVDHE